MEQGITIRQARVAAAQQLTAAGIEGATLDARVLLAHVLGIDPTQVLIRDLDPMPSRLEDEYRQLVSQRATGVPLAYLTGHREFMGLSFITTPDVLVPRPDTEPLVEWGLEWLRHRPEASVADIGTGSGAIGVSIAFHASRPIPVVVTDVSEPALNVATRNADQLLPPERRSLFQPRLGFLTEPLLEPVDLLLTNLPYLTPAQISGTPDLRHEPHLALDGGEDGLDLIRAVISNLRRVLNPSGAIGLEIDPSQADTVAETLSIALPQHNVHFVLDIAHHKRHVVAEQQ